MFAFFCMLCLEAPLYCRCLCNATNGDWRNLHWPVAHLHRHLRYVQNTNVAFAKTLDLPKYMSTKLRFSALFHQGPSPPLSLPPKKVSKSSGYSGEPGTGWDQNFGKMTLTPTPGKWIQTCGTKWCLYNKWNEWRDRNSHKITGWRYTITRTAIAV